MTTIDHHIKQGDTKGYIQRQLSYDDGSPIDLTGCAVLFKYKRKDGSGPAVSRTATIVDTIGGVVRYDWQAADSVNPAVFIYEWEVTDGSSGVLTVPNQTYGLFQVVADIRN